VLVFWGDQWKNGTSDSRPYIDGVKAVLSSPFLEAAAQYGAGPMSYETEVYVTPIVSHFINTANGPQEVFKGADSDQMLETKLVGTGAPFPSPTDPAERLYVVMIPPGIDGDGNYTFDPVSQLWKATPNTGGWHGALSINGQWRPIAVVMTWSVDNATIVFSHELVEACTDSRVNGVGIYLQDDREDGAGEVADPCGYAGRLNGAAVTSYWSQDDGACVVPTLATWQRLADPGLSAESVRLVRRRDQLILFALRPDEGLRNATLLVLLQDDPLRDDTIDDWWTEARPPEWLAFFPVPGVPILGYANYTSYAVGINQDLSIRVYVITKNGQLWQNGETVSPYSSGTWRGWSGWKMVDDLGGMGSGIEAATDRLGRTVLFVSMKTQPGLLRFAQEQPNSRQFLPPEPMDFEAIAWGTTAATNQDGRLEVFALQVRYAKTGANIVLRHQWERSAVGSWEAAGADLDLWPPDASVGHRVPTSLDGPVAAGRRKDGRIVVLATDHNRGWHSLQSGNPGWSGFSSIRKVWSYAFAPANQRDHLLTLAVADEKGDVWTAIEGSTGGWRAWTPIGGPGNVDHLCGVLDRHMRIDLIAQQGDGSIWHSRQTHPDHAWIAR
jgi:hypothetical protein